MDIKGATAMDEELLQAYFNQPILRNLGWGTKLTKRQALAATKDTAKFIGFCARKIQREKYLNEVSPFTETLAKTMDLGEAYSQYLDIVIKRLDDDKKPETKTSVQDQHPKGADDDDIPLLGEVHALLQQTVDIIERELARKEAEKNTTIPEKAAEDEKAAIYQICREYNKDMDRFAKEIREKIQQSVQAEVDDKAETLGGQDKAQKHSQESRAAESAKKKKTGGSCCSMV